MILDQNLPAAMDATCRRKKRVRGLSVGSGTRRDDARRDTDCNGPDRNVLADHGPGTDDGVLADRDAVEDLGARAHPRRRRRS